MHQFIGRIRVAIDLRFDKHPAKSTQRDGSPRNGYVAHDELMHIVCVDACGGNDVIHVILISAICTYIRNCLHVTLLQWLQ